MEKKDVICFTASFGGHFEELMCLKELMDENDCFCITEVSEVFRQDSPLRTHYFRQLNRREPLFIPHFIKVTLKSLYIYMKERPRCIISLGALITVPICVIGKIFGSKVIYIESFARISDASMTGKLMTHVADEFLVQWPEMKEVYPGATYVGGLF